MTTRWVSGNKIRRKVSRHFPVVWVLLGTSSSPESSWDFLCIVWFFARQSLSPVLVCFPIHLPNRWFLQRLRLIPFPGGLQRTANLRRASSSRCVQTSLAQRPAPAIEQLQTRKGITA